MGEKAKWERKQRGHFAVSPLSPLLRRVPRDASHGQNFCDPEGKEASHGRKAIDLSDNGRRGRINS